METENNTPVEAGDSQVASFLFSEPNRELEASIAEQGGGQAAASQPSEAELAAQMLQSQTAETQKLAAPTEVNTPATATTQPPVVVSPVVAPVVEAFVPDPAVLAQLAPQAAPVVQPAQVAPVVQQQQQQAAPPVQLSEADIKKHLGVYEVNEADYDAIFATDDKKESMTALNSMLQKAVAQAVTMAHVIIQDQQQALVQQVQPYMQFADEQRRGMMEHEFYNTNPDLAQSKPIVDAVLANLRQSGQKFPDAKTLFDTVAKQSKAYLSHLTQLGQTAPGAPNGQQSTQGGKPPMAVQPSGGSGGSGVKSGNAGGQNKTAASLFAR